MHNSTSLSQLRSIGETVLLVACSAVVATTSAAIDWNAIRVGIAGYSPVRSAIDIVLSPHKANSNDLGLANANCLCPSFERMLDLSL